MKLFNGRRSLIISDDKWRSVLLLSSNLYLSDVEVRLINLTFLAHQPFSSFNVRVPSKKNFYNFRQYGLLMNVMNTGNCSVLGPKLPVLSRSQEKCCIDLDKTYLKVCQAPGCQDIAWATVTHTDWSKFCKQSNMRREEVWSQDGDNNGFLIVIRHSELRDTVLNMIRHDTKIHVTSLSSHSLATPE